MNICNTLVCAIYAELVIFSKTNALYLNSKISKIGAAEWSLFICSSAVDEPYYYL